MLICNMSNSTKHFPKLDDQGCIECCFNEAISYMQMTVAVSKKIGKEDWNPSKSLSARFSPKFTYLLSHSGPQGIYNFIKDHGCITRDKSDFVMNNIGGAIEFEDNSPIKESVAWNVKCGELKEALQYRITDYEILSSSSTNPQLLISRIKQTVDDGNVVVAISQLQNWIETEMTNDCGTYGKCGDAIVVASRRYVPGGHGFVIVGYDDEIEVDFAGQTLKGAFCITCSCGDSWKNNGYCWLAYDALYSLSQYAPLNKKQVYNGPMYLTSYYDKSRVFLPTHISNTNRENQNFAFIKDGVYIVEGKEYPVYYIQDVNSKKYLGLTHNADPAQQIVEFSSKGDNADRWCIVPYKELVKWRRFSESAFDPTYENCYWIFSEEYFSKDPLCRCFLDSGLRYYDIGRRIGHSRFNDGNYPQAKSWIIENYPPTESSFISKLKIYSKDEKLSIRRTNVFKDYCFVDYEKNVEIGLPKLMVDIELETIDREAFEVYLLRKDENGVIDVHVPAMFQLPHKIYVSGTDVMSFSGEINSSLPELGFFTFQYSDLLNIPVDKKMTDYQWGVQIRSKNNHPVIIKKVAIVNSRNEELDSISFYENPIALCNESVAFITGLNSVIE